MITNKANLELWKKYFTTRSATKWNMFQGEVIDSKLHGKIKYLFTIGSATDWNMLPGEVIDSKLQEKVKQTRAT